MSIDTVDMLHAAEAEIGRLRTIIDDIWEHLQMPFEWDADTIEGVAQILNRHGWTQVPDDVIAPIADDWGYEAANLEDRYGRGRLSAATTTAEFEAIYAEYTPSQYERLGEDEDEDEDESTCRHCGRPIVFSGGMWVDPAATDDDEIWRETCDEHDTFNATHEPEGGE